MEIYYLNSKGERVNLDRSPYKMLAKTGLFDYSWDYTTSGSVSPTVGRFSQTMKTRSFSLAIRENTVEALHARIHRLMDVFGVDVVNKTPGKLYVGKSYLSCYVIQSKKGGRYINTTHASVEFTILAEKGQWVTEVAKTFGAHEVTGADSGLDYPHDYAFDYASDLTSQFIVNENYAPANFVMTIFGQCINPMISVGSHTYAIAANIQQGEYAVIDSSNKQIYKVKNNGEKVNLFSNRGRDFYIFEKIPSGTSSVIWTGGFGFDMRLLQERSEPAWI